MMNNNFPNFLNFPTMPPMRNFQNMQNMPNMSNIQNMQNNFQQPNIQTINFVKNEFDNLYSNPLSSFGFSVGLLHDNDFSKWRITLTGPKDTPYSGGIYKIMVSFPNNYPSAPPLIYFITPIYHLNINPFANERGITDPLGFVPIQRLKIWKPEYSMAEVITYLYGLFYYVDLECAYGSERLNEYQNNRAVYVEKIKYFVQKYATASKFALDWANMGWNFQIYN